MEFGLREWAILIGFIAIAFVLWDGFRRSRGNSKYKLPFNMNPHQRTRGDDSDELESTPDPLTRPQMRQNDLFEEDLVDVETTKHADVDLGLDDDGLSAPRVKDPSKAVYEPDLRDLEATEPYQPGAPAQEPSLNIDEPAFVETGPGEGIGKPRIKVSSSSPTPSGSPADEIPKDVITLFVIPKTGGAFKGVELRNALVAMGLSLGDRDLYHRHTGSGRDVLYSVADASEAGTFPQGAMEGFTSKGVILLIELTGHPDPEHGFEEMISSARQMSRRLKADVLDSHQKPLQLEFINEAKVRVKARARQLRQGGLAG